MRFMEKRVVWAEDEVGNMHVEETALEPDKIADIEADTAKTQTIKVTLVNTPLKVDALCRKLDKTTGYIGFDTEVAGPLLRGRDFVNITYAALLGISLAFEDGKCYYIPFRHKGNNASFMDLHQIASRLQHQAKQHHLWAHNAKFDHQVMSMAGYPLTGLLDSMVAAWLVTGSSYGIGLKHLADKILGRKSPEYDPSISHKTGDAVKIYAGHDALNTLELGLHFLNAMETGQVEWFVEECIFAHSLADMKLAGFRLDRNRLQELREEAQKEQNQLQHTWNELCPDISITSSKQQQALFEEGIWVPHGTTDGGQHATGGTTMQWNVLNAKGDGKRLAQLKLNYQEVAKIVTTYTDGLIEEALQWSDKRLHPDLFHFGTVTGRLASANPNIQNMPAHGSYAAKVRACFIPDAGMEFTSADYSQVELRYFADYCGSSLAEAFIEGADLHQRTADAMGITRSQAKTVNFGFLLYGGGPDKMAEDLGCSRKEADEKIEALQAEYPEVAKWKEWVLTVVRGRGTNPWAKTLAGRIRYFPELNPDYLKTTDPVEYQRLNKKYEAGCRRRGKKPGATGLEWSIRGRGERLVINYLIQGGARDLLVLGMNKYRATAPPAYTIVTTVHDEVLTQHPIGCGTHACDLLKSALESAGPTLGLKVPIVAEPVTGRNWSEVK